MQIKNFYNNRDQPKNGKKQTQVKQLSCKADSEDHSRISFVNMCKIDLQNLL